MILANMTALTYLNLSGQLAHAIVFLFGLGDAVHAICACAVHVLLPFCELFGEVAGL